MKLNVEPDTAAASGRPLDRQPVVWLVDSVGTKVSFPGIPVLATVLAGQPVFADSQRVTDAFGVVTYTNLTLTANLNQQAGYRLKFSSDLNEVAADTALVATHLATSLSITTQPPTTATTGVALSSQPVMHLIDFVGTTVNLPNVAIIAQVKAVGTATVTAGSPANTSLTGVATFSGLTLTGTAGANTLQFLWTGLATPVDAGVVTTL